MTDQNSSDDAVYIVDYNPQWTKLAEEEVAVLKKLFLNQNWIIDIQHIGSTAIPGMAAKPIIDIYIGASSIEEAIQAIEPLEKIGYVFWYDNPNKEKMFFVKGMPPFGTGRTHHVHIVKHDSDYWRARILFRDYMRSHPNEIQEYANLKYDLMQKYGNDREAYTDAKSEYIATILKKAGFEAPVRR